MADTLLVTYIAIISAVMVVLLVWLVWMLVDQTIRSSREARDAREARQAQLDAQYRGMKLVPIEEPAKEEKKEEVAPVVEEKKEEVVPVVEEKKEEVAPVVEEKKEEPAPVVEEEVAEEEAETEDENAVVLVRRESLTYKEAYSALAAREKNYVDDIISYAKAKEDAKEVETDKNVTVYEGKKKLVTVLIRKGVVIAKIAMPNLQLNAFADTNDMKFKEKPIDIKVTGPEVVGKVKDVIDLVHTSLLEDKARKEAEKKERRRQARLAKKAQEGK